MSKMPLGGRGGKLSIGLLRGVGVGVRPPHDLQPAAVAHVRLELGGQVVAVDLDQRQLREGQGGLVLPEPRGPVLALLRHLFVQVDHREIAHACPQAARDPMAPLLQRIDAIRKPKDIAPAIAALVAWSGAGLNLRTGALTAEQIRNAVRPNIHFPADDPGNPVAEVEVKCAPDGTIVVWTWRCDGRTPPSR